MSNKILAFIESKDGKFKNSAFEVVAEGNKIAGETGSELMKKHNLTSKDIDSVILIDADRAYIKSDAALRIAAELGGIYKLISYLRFIPKFIRDYFYDIVAIDRYKWFGKKDTCRIPTPELKSKFL